MWRMPARPLHGLPPRPVSDSHPLLPLTDERVLIQCRAKKDKYPYGYPGDEFGVKSVARYGCHDCKTPFPPNATAETQCLKCSHKKCDSCKRLAPRKVEPEPDPEVWKTIQVKLAELKLK